MISNFGTVFIFACTMVVFVLATFLISRILRTDKPNVVKLSTYESGEESVGALNSTFNAKYYIIALAFLLFEVELILLFPWALVFANASYLAEYGSSWYWLAFAELLIFIALLAIGLAYIWAKGHLDWGYKTQNKKNDIPEIYQNFNKQMSSHASHNNI
jgi:NADH-quinone oxidoreductase subunit A